MLRFLFVNKKEPCPLPVFGEHGQVSIMEFNSFARLKGLDVDFYMTKKRVVIGRNSKLGDVDVNMGNSRFISRRHLEIALDRNSFYVFCRGKNGVYLDDTFHTRENRRLQLPNP